MTHSDHVTHSRPPEYVRGAAAVPECGRSRLESGDRNVGVTVLQALTLTMPDVRFVIEAGELRIEMLPTL